MSSIEMGTLTREPQPMELGDGYFFQNDEIPNLEARTIRVGNYDLVNAHLLRLTSWGAALAIEEEMQDRKKMSKLAVVIGGDFDRATTYKESLVEIDRTDALVETNEHDEITIAVEGMRELLIKKRNSDYAKQADELNEYISHTTNEFWVGMTSKNPLGRNSLFARLHGMYVRFDTRRQIASPGVLLRGKSGRVATLPTEYPVPALYIQTKGNR